MNPCEDSVRGVRDALVPESLLRADLRKRNVGEPARPTIDR
jgi:hypothetical protein